MVRLPRTDSALGEGEATASCAPTRPQAAGASRTMFVGRKNRGGRRTEKPSPDRGESAARRPNIYSHNPIPGAAIRSCISSRSVRPCSRGVAGRMHGRPDPTRSVPQTASAGQDLSALDWYWWLGLLANRRPGNMMRNVACGESLAEPRAYSIQPVVAMVALQGSSITAQQARDFGKCKAGTRFGF